MTNLRNLRMPLAVAAVAISSALILSAWDFKNTYAAWNDDNDYEKCDTIPKKDSREKKIRDLDDVLDELNNVDLKVNMEKVQKEIAEAMKKIDAQKIQVDIEKAMREIDMQKIQKEVQESMAKIDWDKMKKDMEEYMEKIDWNKMQADLNRVKDIDLKKMQLDMEKLQVELSKIGPEIEKSMENAKVEIEKAKVEMKEYNNFVDGLEKDGLLNKKEGYSIKHKDGELIINGKKASDATYNKYKSFLEKHKKFTIEKSGDDFNIDID